MEQCSLCGARNPDNAVICTKCGYDLREDPAGDSSVDISELDTFTPAASAEDALLARRAARMHKLTVEPGEIEAYKEQATAQSQAAFENQNHEIDSGEPPEIELSIVNADFVNKKKACGNCGISNPYEQRFCRHCGADLDEQSTADQEPGLSSAPTIPLAPPPELTFEHAMLTDLHSAPASDYFGAREDAPGGARRAGPLSSITAKRGLSLWLLIIATVLMAAALTWLLAFSGFDMLFNARMRRIKKAAAAMEDLTSYQYTVGAAVETADDIRYGGGGRAVHEYPHRSLWNMTLNAPGGPITTEAMLVDEKVYINGSLQQSSSSGNARADVADLWKGVRSVEDLGNQAVGVANCRHYKYRVPPNLATTILGVGNQTGASDAVVEAWIDTVTAQVVRMTVQVFNVQIAGASTTVLLAMDLVDVGQPYNISAPSQQPSPSSAP